VQVFEWGTLHVESYQTLMVKTATAAETLKDLKHMMLLLPQENTTE
jgi:hypothetical protein